MSAAAGKVYSREILAVPGPVSSTDSTAEKAGPGGWRMGCPGCAAGMGGAGGAGSVGWATCAGGMGGVGWATCATAVGGAGGMAGMGPPRPGLG